MNKLNTGRKTAAIFVDDGGDDAYEFATNYIRFDPSDSLDRHRAWREARALWATRVGSLSEAGRLGIAQPRLCSDNSSGWTEEDLRESA